MSLVVHRPRLRCVVLVVALLLTGVRPAQAAGAAAEAGRVVEGTFTNDAGTRRYRIYVPPSGAAGRPLMVWLHGCGQPGAMRAGHALAKVAEEHSFTLVFPLQDRAANPQNCWNWYSETDRHRGKGEASIIAGLTTTMVRELRVDAARVYVGGYSAGGAMTSVMGATYPDVYAAIAPSSGAPYGFDPSGEQAYKEMGPRARPLPAFLLQGVADEISVYPIGRTNLLQWLGTADFADDGRDNGSVSRFPAEASPQLPGPSTPVPLMVEDYRTTGGGLLARFLTAPTDHLVNAALLYQDIGLGIQRQMMEFLLAHRRE